MQPGSLAFPDGASTVARSCTPRARTLVAGLKDSLEQNPRTPPDRLLAQAGCLDPRVGRDPAWLLRETAAFDLSLARLLEGHVNALDLIRCHADDETRRVSLRESEEGHLFGVWGADSERRVAWENGRLSGAKRYASGLGFVSRAIVTAQSEEGQLLCVVDASDRGRHDPGAWEMSGMQESRSGRFDCDSLTGVRIGQPDCYTREPHFIGGTWRIAAVTAGGIVGLLDRTAEALKARGHLDSEPQLLRLAPVAGRLVAAWPAILRAAAIAAGPEGQADPERAATLSIASRLLLEDLGQDAIAAAERSLGLAMFDVADPAGRAARDLACYLRQAGRDAFSIRTGRAFLGGRSLADWLDD